MSFSKTFVAGMLLAATASYAAAADPVWVDLTGAAASSFTLKGASGKKETTFSYTPVASEVFVYDGGNLQQGPDKIETVVESLFNLPSTGAGSLTLLASGDLTGGQASGPTEGSFTVASATSFNYLAVHYGGGELVFHWNTAQAANSLFTFTGLPNGISNYRAYSSVAAVPEPATYGMLLGGLALMGVVARRRARK